MGKCFQWLIQDKRTLGGTAEYFVYDGDNVLASYDSGGTLNASYLTPGLDANVSMTNSTDTYYYFQDALGSVRNVVESDETIANTYDYRAFGILITETENVDSPFEFTGRDREPGGLSHMHYYRNRYYMPGNGIFTFRDAMWADVHRGWGYVGNTPTMFVDPMGLVRPDIDYRTAYDETQERTYAFTIGDKKCTRTITITPVYRITTWIAGNAVGDAFVTTGAWGTGAGTLITGFGLAVSGTVVGSVFGVPVATIGGALAVSGGATMLTGGAINRVGDSFSKTPLNTSQRDLAYYERTWGPIYCEPDGEEYCPEDHPEDVPPQSSEGQQDAE